MLFNFFCRVEGFVDKNRDAQQDVFFDFLEKSKKGLVQELCEFKVSRYFSQIRIIKNI